jgi:hypothetical protein
MTIVQERTLSMQLATINLLDSSPAFITALPNYPALYAAFKATVDQIKKISKEQSNVVSIDKTKSKKDLRQTHTLKTLQLNDVLKAYFAFTNNIAHGNTTDATITSLNRLADNNFVNKCEQIYDLALPLAADLTPYGIDAAWLAAYHTELNSFSSITMAPRVATVNRAAFTNQLNTLFATAKTQLDHLTLLINLTQYSQPSFYFRYKDVIKIIDAKSSPLALRLSVKSLTGISQSGFTVSFLRQSNGEVTTFKTNPNGILQRRNMPAGVYEITVSKVDYAPLTGKIAIIGGETYLLEVRVDTTAKTFKDGRNPKTGEAI